MLACCWSELRSGRRARADRRIVTRRSGMHRWLLVLVLMAGACEDSSTSADLGDDLGGSIDLALEGDAQTGDGAAWDAALGDGAATDGGFADGQGGGCVGGAPNGTPDPGEECDDGNRTSGDGCENTCVYSCHLDTEC